MIKIGSMIITMLVMNLILMLREYYHWIMWTSTTEMVVSAKFRFNDYWTLREQRFIIF